MRALNLIINTWLIISLQVFLTGSLHVRTYPHPDSYRDPQGGLNNQLPTVGLSNSDSPFEGGKGDVIAGKSIKIGLLIQDNNSPAARYGAELAIKKANEEGGVNGVPLQMIVSSMEGPWGTGSKQAVSMIFDEDVVAILGSHDGRNAHLVEQVTAKSRVVFLSAWSGDPTLAQAFIPWFFNCVYNDAQISDALIEDIYTKRKLGKIAVVYDSSYDSGSQLKNFLKKVESHHRPEPMQLIINDATKDLIDVTGKLKATDIDCIILFIQPSSSLKLIEQLIHSNVNHPIYGTMVQLDENTIPVQDLKVYDNVMFASPVNFMSKSGTSFVEEYRKNYGVRPGAVAACAFDGMNILIESIRKGGTEREMLQKAMTDIKYEGVTGSVRFDEKGNREGTPGFVEIKNGIPVFRQ